ncbi:hypothetical protein [Pseudomonas rhodesiae]|uniref:hypothetical protein n=1 Tax=Pseudomonas rhodesiae TaxID=76760 RepID=UPI00058F4147|nr:hypothetical protein [Pseudomonas rhodesiae]
MQSVKTGMEIRLESAGELAIAKLLDLDPRSHDLTAQGQTFDLGSGEIYAALPDSKAVDSRYYTYDLSNQVGGIRYIYEVKPQRFCQRHEVLFSAVDTFCRSKGMRFVVLTREEFGDLLLKNIEVLHQFHRQASSYLANLAEAVDALSIKQGHVRQVLKSLEPMNHYLIAALLNGVLKVDLSSSSILSMDFHVMPAHGELSMLQVLSYA